MTIAYVNAGTVGTGTTSVTPGAPASLTNTNGIITVLVTKPNTATLTTPANWALMGTNNGGAGTQGTDTGPSKLGVYFREKTAAWSAMSAHTVGASPNSTAVMSFQFSKAATHGWEYDNRNGTYNSAAADTSLNSTPATPIDMQVGDWILVAFSNQSDGPTWSGYSLTSSGVTFGTITEFSEAIEGTTGQDVGGGFFGAEITAISGGGPVTQTVAIAATSVGDSTGALVMIRLRERRWELTGVGAIASTVAFGSAVVTSTYNLSPSGIASTVSFGTADVDVVAGGSQDVSPGGIASTVALGTAKITLYVVPSGVASTVALGSPTITTGAVSVAPSGIASTVAFGTAVVTRGAVNVAPTGISSTVSLGSLTVTSTYAITVSSITSTAALGSATVTTGAVTIAPASITSTTIFGSATITTGAVNVAPASITSTVALGSATVTATYAITVSSIATTVALGSATVTATYAISVSGIDSTVTLGSATLSGGSVTIAPSGIASTASLGSPTVTTGAVNISPSGIASTVSFGSHTVAVGGGSQSVTVSSISDTETFGTAVVTRGAVNVSPVGISDTPTFGTAAISRRISVTGIGSTASLGSPALTTTRDIAPSGIGPTTSLGTPRIRRYIIATGITNVSTLGTPELEIFNEIFPPDIGPTATLGTPTILSGGTFLFPNSIVDGPTFGTAVLNHYRNIVLDVTLSPETHVGELATEGHLGELAVLPRFYARILDEDHGELLAGDWYGRIEEP